jgi:fumarylacetoacetate (FAA) hydrolase
MILASRKRGRDGELLVVSRDRQTCVQPTSIAPTLQSALDRWDVVIDDLLGIFESLNQGSAKNTCILDLSELGPPLPRAYQYLDGACYLSHIRRNREARGETLPDDIMDAPLMYQGISHGYLGWNDPIRLPRDDLGIDFEAEIAAITGEIPLGVSADEATQHIRLFTLLNDISLRAIVPAELKRTFGFLTGKPASALGPFAVTPDELGDLWDGELVSGKMKCWVRGELIGEIETGIDTPFHYGHAIAHVAQTRDFEPGTIVGLGTVSNEDDKAGFGCIGEARAFEIIQTGEASLAFLKFGESVRLDLFDYDGNSILGAIDQEVRAI